MIYIAKKITFIDFLIGLFDFFSSKNINKSFFKLKTDKYTSEYMNIFSIWRFFQISNSF